jgi:hypothetical protein
VNVLLALGAVALPVPHRLPLDARSAAIFVALGLFALLLARRRPVYALALLVLLIPFDLARYTHGTTVTLPKVALLGALAGLALRRPSLDVLTAPRSRPLVFGMLAILAATALTAIPGVYIDAVARETLKTLEYAAAFAFAAVTIRAEPDEGVIWSAVELGAASVAFLALAQLFTVAPSRESRAHSRVRISSPDTLTSPSRCCSHAPSRAATAGPSRSCRSPPSPMS